MQADRKAALKAGDPAERARNGAALLLLDAATEAARAGNAAEQARFIALAKGIGYEIGLQRTGGGYLRAIRFAAGDVDPAGEAAAMAEIGKIALRPKAAARPGEQRVAIGRA